MWFKEIYSTCLLLFCSLIVLTMIFQKNTKLFESSSWATFFVFLISLYWLSMVEGGQTSLVSLLPVDIELYKTFHPTTHKIMNVINRGNTIECYEWTLWSFPKGRNGFIYTRYHCSLSFRYFWSKWASQLQQQNKRTSTSSQTTGPPRMYRHDQTLPVNDLNGLYNQNINNNSNGNGNNHTID